MTYNNCQQLRNKLVSQGKLNMATGETTMESQKWVTEACNIPLFDDEGRKTGLCRSCRSGWTHEHNYPVKG